MEWQGESVKYNCPNPDNPVVFHVYRTEMSDQAKKRRRLMKEEGGWNRHNCSWVSSSQLVRYLSRREIE
jgi:hypothetical protein